MPTRPHHLAWSGVLAAAVLVTVAGCASGAKPTRVPPSYTGTPVPSVMTTPSPTQVPTAAPPPVPTDAPTAAPSVAPSVAPSIVMASPVATPAPSVVATERPGPTPIVGEVKPAPEFVDLVQSDGTPFTLAGLHGQPAILFFGYTHCPDVCPATIGELIGVQQARPDVRVVFITIDPERDTPEFLAEWTKYLPQGLVGVTGSPLAIRRAADSYGARYARVDTDSRNGYSMSHTAFQYLIDGEGNLALTYPFGTPAGAIIGDLDALALAG